MSSRLEETLGDPMLLHRPTFELVLADIGEIFRVAESLSRTLVLSTDGVLAASDALNNLFNSGRDRGRSEYLVVREERLNSGEAVGEIVTAVHEVNPTAMFAVGGGSLIDAAKVARVALAQPWLLDQRLLAALPGVRTLREVGERGVPLLVCAPTRPGSAAEVTPRATIVAGPETPRRLLLGRSLCPEVALVDARLALTLDLGAWMESIAEVAFRLVIPFVDTSRSNAAADTAAIGLLRRLKQVFTVVRKDGPSLGAGQEIAELSRLSATGWHMRKWAPLMPAAWCLQNTICSLTNQSKGFIVGRLLPHIITMIAAGQETFGSNGRLRLLRLTLGEDCFQGVFDICRAARGPREQISKRFSDPGLWVDITKRLWPDSMFREPFDAQSGIALLHAAEL